MTLSPAMVTELGDSWKTHHQADTFGGLVTRVGPRRSNARKTNLALPQAANPALAFIENFLVG